MKSSSSLPLVALIGRTNVGKSTLWNRLTDTGRALVSEDPHTTRDRKPGIVLWNGLAFSLMDTGGLDTEETVIGQAIYRQSEHAIREADLILFVIDGRTGVLPQDIEFAQKIKREHKNIILVANKIDHHSLMPSAYQPEIARLSLGTALPVSAATGYGVGDALDFIFRELEQIGKPPQPRETLDGLRVAIVGRPNVGKSSIVNSILKEDRVIVSPLPHTTREPQDTFLTFKDQKIILVDTAGMRRQRKTTKGLEDAAMERNREAIKKCDVAVLVFDAAEGPTGHDRELAGELAEANKGVILVANKWDLIEDKKTGTANKTELLLRQLLPFLSWAPMIFTSATEHQRTSTILDSALLVQQERYRMIDYNAINRLLKACIKSMKPLASYGPKSPRIYDVAQIGSAPPKFVITVHGEKENLHHNWIKFFEKRVRDKFGFIGTPIMVKARHMPVAKSEKRQHGPGMEAVAGRIREKKRLVNQTQRRQKHGGHRY